MAGSFVVGLGAGVIILLVLWTLVVVAWMQLSQQQTALRSFVTFLSIFITVMLLIIPTDDGLRPPEQGSPLEVLEMYDYMFIWKGILICLMGLCIMAALGVYLKEFWLTKVHGSLPVPTKKVSEEYQ